MFCCRVHDDLGQQIEAAGGGSRSAGLRQLIISGLAARQTPSGATLISRPGQLPEAPADGVLACPVAVLAIAGDACLMVDMETGALRLETPAGIEEVPLDLGSLQLLAAELAGLLVVIGAATGVHRLRCGLTVARSEDHLLIGLAGQTIALRPLHAVQLVAELHGLFAAGVAGSVDARQGLEQLLELREVAA